MDRVEEIVTYRCPLLPNACASAMCWYDGLNARPERDCEKGLELLAKKYEDLAKKHA